MPKLLFPTTGLIAVTASVVLASLILNIIVLNKVNNDNNYAPSAASFFYRPASSSIQEPDKHDNIVLHTAQCPAAGNASSSPNWMLAASDLLRGLDPTFDPCEDMYSFSCGTYLRKIQLDGYPRVGTYDEIQNKVNRDIYAYTKNFINSSSSLTERITKRALDSCLIYSPYPDDAEAARRWRKSRADLNAIASFPFLEGTNAPSTEDLFTALGQMEREFAIAPLLGSFSTVDYKNVSRNALFVGQPVLINPLDYYTLPQYIGNLDDYRDMIVDVLLTYQAMAGVATPKSDDEIVTFAEQMVDLERMIAMSSWPDTKLRNFGQQYNPYTLDQLNTRFPAISMRNYMNALTAGIDTGTEYKVIIQMPTYFFWLNGAFAGGSITTGDIANYVSVQYLLENVYYLPVPDSVRHLARRMELRSSIERRGRGLRRLSPRARRRFHRNDDDDSTAIDCINDLIFYAPYAAGYVYTKQREDKYFVREDVRKQNSYVIAAFSEQIDSLSWMSDATKASAHAKSAELVQNLLWPDMYGDFENATEVDNYHVDYIDIVIESVAVDYWDILKILRKGFQTRETIRILGVPADRKNFLMSPASVNAWFQSERNSITIPIANLNRPFYDQSFPQAYNYAGQGGTAGHELTHGYDDEGVQFGPFGDLVSCGYASCGILDRDSRKGFIDMAQCVVTQYDQQCCPLSRGNVRCTNGATTQGENIADIGGQLAAYNAYRKYIAEKGEEEELLPGLEPYSANQVFWMTYGFAWCMKYTDDSLIKQVMQDIPQFGADFDCRRGQTMFPREEDRCKVWTGF